MRTFAAALLVFALISASTFSCPAQTPEPQAQDDEKIVVGTNEVMLDAVVRDKKGHAVKDLKASDFQVFEDGVPQEVKSFRLVTREPNATANETKNGTTTSQLTITPPAPLNTNRVGAVALVFDRLSPEARTRARAAALSYVGDEARPNDFIGVFGIDLSLKIFQPFTNNGQLVKQAIDRAGGQSPSTYESRTQEINTLSQNQSQLETQANQLQGAASSGQGGGGQAANAIGANAVEQAFNAMTLRAAETFERLERDQQGYATTDGLLAIINALGRLPGRKAMVLFSEGLAIPSAVESRFRAVISNANRANVSIYTVDAAGLRAVSSDREAGGAMTTLGQRRAQQASSKTDFGDGPMMRDLERNEDLIRLNPESGLGQLANQTGGLLISSTNNPGPRLRQIDEDLHAYYLLTYSPKNQKFDGHFRQITVKLDRPDVEVQARKGYYAIGQSYDTPVLDYEAPALAILSGNSQPNAFVSHVAAFSFPEPAMPGLVPVVVEVPPGAINYVTSTEKKAYGTNFSIVVLVRDEEQRVVRKLSNQYLLSGALDKLDVAKRGEVLFYRETQLDPGRYTIAAVVYDATTGQASTNTASIVVPNVDQSKPRLSSVIFIKNAERIAATDQSKSNPFHFGDVLIYPNLDEPLSKAASKDLALFATIYPPKGTTSGMKLRLEVMQGSHTLGHASYDLPAPDQTGRIQYASAIPIDKYQPGDYELRLTVEDAKGTVTQSAHFTIKP